MKIIRAKTAGFCMGVSLALKTLDKAIAKRQQNNSTARIVTWGPIIHNPRVMNAYAAQNVLCLENLAEVQKGDIVLIRAHGVPKEVVSSLVSQNVFILDATCPKVKKAQQQIAKLSDTSDETLLLFGEAEHPEVKGLVSYAKGIVFTFPSLNELKKYPLSPEGTYNLAAQTTQDQEEFLKIQDYLKSKLKIPFKVLHTICEATKKRQSEIIELGKKADGVIVIGGSNSGNTRRLAEISSLTGVQTFLIESTTELDPLKLKGMESIVITAGASTPASHIEEVERYLRTL